jgi:hypothetical protein
VTRIRIERHDSVLARWELARCTPTELMAARLPGGGYLGA